ncbi:3'(2'),5'-bisphosphate nucleotidase CysQ [Ulvibacterium marinum]|uniref:3'(2'),5'-bisphosphate nucleotidase CysQ n=1 Tax=Ulvibacterium marinum TaxID=2419782 RepID=UPI002493FA59|nr:3'(2'),5'-bisphosphate nucleotidase CysQ [Ulvibacterium marinum]
MTANKDLLQIALTASVHAGKAILQIYYRDNSIKELKEDLSPLTEADIASNAIINDYLMKTPFPIISEEAKSKDYSVRETWETCWIVDPLDGTKEFIKGNGEFTVNIALCKSGKPILGIIYVPVLRELYYANVPEKKAYKTILDTKHEPITSFFSDQDLIISSKKKSNKVKVVGSRSHMNQETMNFIAKLKDENKQVEIVSKGSSLKFCMVAEGKADIYPRFAPTMEWDTAAGQAICSAVGLKVISKDTNKILTYNKKRLLNPHFIVRP